MGQQVVGGAAIWEALDGVAALLFQTEDNEGLMQFRGWVQFSVGLSACVLASPSLGLTCLSLHCHHSTHTPTPGS